MLTELLSNLTRENYIDMAEFTSNILKLKNTKTLKERQQIIRKLEKRIDRIDDMRSKIEFSSVLDELKDKYLLI